MSFTQNYYTNYWVMFQVDQGLHTVPLMSVSTQLRSCIVSRAHLRHWTISNAAASTPSFLSTLYIEHNAFPSLMVFEVLPSRRRPALIYWYTVVFTSCFDSFDLCVPVHDTILCLSIAVSSVSMLPSYVSCTICRQLPYTLNMKEFLSAASF